MLTDLPGTFPPVFACRRTELKSLRDALHAAQQGAGSFTVVCGEAGIGKSALIEQFYRENERPNVVFISAEFKESEIFEPYAPFLRVLERLQGLDNGAQQSKPEELLRLTFSPDERDTPAGFYSLQSQLGLAQQRLRAAIIGKTKRTTVVLQLVNLHLAPLTSWRFIHYLAESLSDHGLLLLASLRLDKKLVESSGKATYIDVLQRMNREQLYKKINLRRFELRQTRRMIKKILPYSDLPSHFIPDLHDLSQGIPGKLLRCLHSLLASKLLFQENQIWFCQENIDRDLLQVLIQDEQDADETPDMDVLSQAQLELLNYAALMGEAFGHQTLASVTGRSRVSIIKDLVTFVNRKVLVSTEDERYRFSHSGLRAAIAARIPESERLSRHQQVAAVVEAATYLTAAQRTYCLAHHYSNTPDHAAAFKYLRQAGDNAIKNFAFWEATDFYERAVRLAKSYPEQFDADTKVELLISTSWLNRVLGFWDASIENCREALGDCEALTNPRLKNHVLLQQGLTFFRKNNWAQAESSLLQCLKDQENLSQFDQALVHYGLGNIQFELSDFQKASDHYEAALEFAEQPEAKQLIANLYNNMGALKSAQGRRMQAIAFYSKSIPVFENLGDNLGLARVYHNIGMTHADEQEWQKANEFCGKSLGVSDVMGLTPLKSITFLNRALCLARLGNLTEASEYNFKALRLLKKLEDELGLAEHHKIQGIIECARGNWKQSAYNLKTAYEKYAEIENKLGCAEAENELAHLAVSMNDTQEAKRWLEKALASYQQLHIKDKVEAIAKELAEFEESDARTLAGIETQRGEF